VKHNNSIKLIFVIFIIALEVSGCGSNSGNVNERGNQELRSVLQVPPHLPMPAIPSFNPPTAEKIELGRFLFYDKKLSANQTQSCASCHEQALAFTDGKQRAVGSTGQVHFRNSQSLANAMYNSSFTWANNGFLWLEDQIIVPLVGDNPVELGITDSVRPEVLQRFANDPLYQELFAKAFPADSTVSLQKIIFALASFCRTIVSGQTPYDRFLQGDETALDEQQKLGLQLFNGEKFECFHCHSGINLTVSHKDGNADPAGVTFSFFNNGLYNLDGQGSYPRSDQGLYDLTGRPSDRGSFRPQSLRNVELTAPYMHDGSIETLEDVIRHYARGGRLISSGPNAGDGKLSPLKSGLIRGFALNPGEMEAVVAFLRSLTDWELLNNPRLSNPFTNPETINISNAEEYD
jgi:cytochrome c peroxidase